MWSYRPTGRLVPNIFTNLKELFTVMILIHIGLNQLGNTRKKTTWTFFVCCLFVCLFFFFVCFFVVFFFFFFYLFNHIWPWQSPWIAALNIIFADSKPLFTNMSNMQFINGRIGWLRINENAFNNFLIISNVLGSVIIHQKISTRIYFSDLSSINKQNLFRIRVLSI